MSELVEPLQNPEKTSEIVPAEPKPEPCLGMENLSDIDLVLEMEIGRSKLSVDDILRLKVGDQLKLDRAASENIQLSIEGVCVGEAEVVSTENGAGVNITSVGSE